MIIVCASRLEEDKHPQPDVLVLPERVSLRDIEAAGSRWPDAVVVGAAAEGSHIRAYALHDGRSWIDYLKFSHDGISEGALQHPPNQVLELGDLMIGVLVCKDFQQPDLLAGVMNKMRSSRARRKVVCIPADMGSEWFPGGPVREFLGAHVALSNNLRTPTHTRRASFILTPEGIVACEQVHHEAITLNAA